MRDKQRNNSRNFNSDSRENSPFAPDKNRNYFFNENIINNQFQNEDDCINKPLDAIKKNINIPNQDDKINKPNTSSRSI